MNAPDSLAELTRRLDALARIGLVAPEGLGPGPFFRALRPPRGPAANHATLIVTPGAPLGLLNRPEEAASRLLDLPAAVLERLRAGAGIVAFDGASEGRPLVATHVAALHGALDRAGIPPHRAAWLQQNRALGPRYAAFCVERGLAPMHIVTTDSYGFLLWDRLFGRLRPPWGWGFALTEAPRRHRWICLNYVLRPHRALIADWLMARPEPGHLSLSTQREAMDAAARARFLADAERLEAGSTGRVAALLGSGLHLGGDTDGFGHPQERVMSLPVPELAAAELFIVTETEMSGGGLLRWTEKTLKAIACGLPFIVFGNPQTVAGLEALGFDLLRDLIDHGYDAEPNPARRFAAAQASVARFLARPAGFTPREMERLRVASAHNREVFAREILRVSALDPLDRLFAMMRGA
ncbi:hypothetical protein KPL78_17350 [Roseomonas sp. HJA6]|uniref:Glycosyltransferase family 1 protein n=1 Tax=Roseomonas alba TaxID=2846776 RepID=A0ABS7ABF3_9PROT|nr:hypothetical protein [Neoroseomonas alba]MBW6399629.1 hypothetical protein [Neoroseomonas alba]